MPGSGDPGGGSGSDDQTLDAQVEGSMRGEGLSLCDRAGCKRRTARMAELEGAGGSFRGTFLARSRLATLTLAGGGGRLAAYASSAGNTSPSEARPRCALR